MVCKKLAITLFFSLFIFGLNAQVEKRGYIGIGIGPSFLAGYDLGGEKAKTGVNVTLANFGYVFAKGFGVSVVWMGGGHQFDEKIFLDVGGGRGTVTGHFEGMVSYAALMIGPLYSVKLSDNSSLDFKARGGGFYARELLSGGRLDFDSEKSSFGYSFAISYQKNFSPHWCIQISTDYYSGEMESISPDNKRLAAIALNAGVGFSF